MNKLPNHPKTIIHVDIDCFYAQVELLKHPHLQNEPVGVQQKNIVVTCNYAAREFGVQKCELVTEALKKCPNMILFNGEDLYKYRQASNQIHMFLLTFTTQVEKLGFDENYIDVTELVSERKKMNENTETFVGHCVGDTYNPCTCGCHERLSLGSQIAHEIRRKLKSELGFTSCCGISYNKLLAKLSCSAHKPDQQTILLPNGCSKFLLDIKEVGKIPGIGVKTKQILESINVKTIKDLREVEMRNLKRAFGSEDTAVNLKNLSLGICHSIVKQTGKPISIGLEDGFRKISVESDVKEKFRMLLQRLMILVEEDGRIPMIVKVTIRKHDSERKTGHKETKQSPVPSSLFSQPLGKLSEESTNKLLNIIMGLFCKIVNTSKPFHLTLLGLSFSRFHEKVSNCTVASFLLKKRDISVQSLTSFVSNETSSESSNVIFPSSSKSESDSETEPSPKKTKLDVLIKKRKLDEEESEMCSPSKLKVESLNLNENKEFPKNIDPNVFRELPSEIQKELMKEWKITKQNYNKQRLILDYYLPNK